MGTKKSLEYLIDVLILIPAIIYIYNSWPKGNIIFEFSYYLTVWSTILYFSLEIVNRASIIGLLPTLLLILIGEYLTENFKPWTLLNNHNELGVFFTSIILILLVSAIIETLFITIRKNKSKELLYSTIITTTIYFFYNQEILVTIAAWLFMFPLWYIIKSYNKIVRESIIVKGLIYNPKTNTYKKGYYNPNNTTAVSLCIWFYFLIVLPIYLYYHKDHLLTVFIDMIKLTSC